ncbi:MAG: hypothetical protein IT165_29650 [Bryobacterales bacterium]|nr:hypothetical protein [Bryobacterales bacterium]
MRPAIVVLLFSGLCFGQFRLPEAEKCEDETFSPDSWPHDQESAKQMGRAEVVDFLHRCGIGDVKGDMDLHDYRFVPMEKGRIYLVAVIPTGGTIGDMLALYHCEPKSCIAFVLSDSAGTDFDLNKDLVSLSGDGVYQVISANCLTGSAPFQIVYYIYEIGENRSLRDASHKYQKWYTEHLYPALVEANRVAQLNQATLAFPFRKLEELSEDTAATQFALDDYRERVLGVRDARLEHAIEWSLSPYHHVRELALRALRDAGESIRSEQVMSVLEKAKFDDVRNGVREIQDERRQMRLEKEQKHQ